MYVQMPHHGKKVLYYQRRLVFVALYCYYSTNGETPLKVDPSDDWLKVIIQSKQSHHGLPVSLDEE